MKYSNEYLAGVEAACAAIAEMEGKEMESRLPLTIRQAVRQRRERLAREKAISDAISLLESEEYCVTPPAPEMPV